MAEKNENQEVVEEIQPVEEQPAIKDSETVADAKIETPEKEGGDMKMKEKPKRPKQLVNNDDDEVIKVDLTKKEEEVEEPVKEEVTEEPVEEVKDVEEKTEDKTKGGIIMTNVQKPDEGIAVAVGLGLKTKTGTRIPMTVKQGDKVKFTYHSVREIKVENKIMFSSCFLLIK